MNNDKCTQPCICETCLQARDAEIARVRASTFTFPPQEEPYTKIDHSHCWTKGNPPCGLKGKHRCCLCHEPVPPQEELTANPKEISSRLAVIPEEPWVAEFDEKFLKMLEAHRDQVDINTLGVPMVAKEVKSFIQKTLEADRKERAGVVRDKIEVAIIMCELNALQKLHMHNAVEGLSEDVMK